jgi:protein involved in polysaccharide export with SLBB domain
VHAPRDDRCESPAPFVLAENVYVNVEGQVRRPGAVNYTSGMTGGGAIALAGGVNHRRLASLRDRRADDRRLCGGAQRTHDDCQRDGGGLVVVTALAVPLNDADPTPVLRAGRLILAVDS